MPPPTVVAVGTAAASVGDIVPAWPTHQADDIGLLYVETSDSPGPAAPTGGWVAVPDSDILSSGAASARTRLQVYWIRATSGTMTDPTVVDVGNHLYGFIITIRGCPTTGDPWDVTAGDATTSASTSVSIPGDTTTVADCLILAGVANSTDTLTAQHSSWANTDLTSVTQRFNGNTDQGNGGGIGLASGVKATAGAFGATTVTLATSSQQGRHTIALKPAPPAGTDLVIADGVHAHAADNIGLTQAHNLTIQEAGHGHQADTFALTQAHNLAVQEAAHAHTADNVVLELGGATLVIQDAVHAHTADNVALTQDHQLTVQDAVHAHTVDNLSLTQAHNLVVGDGLHGHTADNLALTQAHSLAVQDALHAHVADNIILTVGGATLVIQDAGHVHTVDGLVLAQVHELQIAEALHTHTADGLALTQVHALAIADALHGHLADNITLGGFVLWANSEGSGAAVNREGRLVGAASEGGGSAT